MNGAHTVNMDNREQYILRDKIDSDLSQIPLMTDAEIAVMHRYHTWLSMWERIEWDKKIKTLWGKGTPFLILMAKQILLNKSDPVFKLFENTYTVIKEIPVKPR